MLHLTVTVPNIPDGDLRAALDAIRDAWRMFWDHLKPGKGHRKGPKLPQPPLTISGALRSIEVTRGSDGHTWHPHLHAILHLPSSYDAADLLPAINTHMRNNDGSMLYMSPLAVALSAIWRKCWVYAWGRDDAPTMPHYSADISLCADASAVLHAIKYDFKSSDISSIGTAEFAELFGAMHGRQTRRGYGTLLGIQSKAEQAAMRALVDLAIDASTAQLLITSFDSLLDPDRYATWDKLTRHRLYDMAWGIIQQQQADDPAYNRLLSSAFGHLLAGLADLIAMGANVSNGNTSSPKL
jgi:hypothetical protein